MHSVFPMLQYRVYSKRATESRGATRSSRLAARLRASLHRLPSQHSSLKLMPGSSADMDPHILLLAHPFMETFWLETSATRTRSTVIPSQVGCEIFGSITESQSGKTVLTVLPQAV